jgi:hypothetical protein
MTTEITKPALISDNHPVSVYVSNYQVTWDKMKATLPENPGDATPEQIESIKDLRTKCKARYKAIDEVRLGFTRQLDQIKKDLIAEASPLDEDKPEGILKEAKEYQLKAAQVQLEREKEAQAKAEEEARKAAERAALPARYETAMKQAILAKEGNEKALIQASIYNATTETELDQIEADLRKPTVLLPEEYSKIANGVYSGMGVPTEFSADVLEHNKKIKDGLILAFNQGMTTFKRELLTHIEPRRVSLRAGAEADAEAGQRAQEALKREMEDKAKEVQEEGEKAENLAEIEATMSVLPQSISVKVNKVCKPSDLKQWQKVVAKGFLDGIVDAAWCEKNLGKFVTHATKEYRNGVEITGVDYVEEVKV